MASGQENNSENVDSIHSLVVVLGRYSMLLANHQLKYMNHPNPKMNGKSTEMPRGSYNGFKNIECLKHNTMAYTISFKELLKRPIIRNDMPDEWMNKCTDEEIRQWEDEVRLNLIAEGVPEVFPDFNSAFLAKCIDRDIIYNLFKGEHLKEQK